MITGLLVKWHLNGYSDYFQLKQKNPNQNKPDEEKGEDDFSVESHFPSSPLVSKILLLQQIVKAPLAPLQIILEMLPDVPSSWKFTCWESTCASKHDSIP